MNRLVFLFVCVCVGLAAIGGVMATDSMVQPVTSTPTWNPQSRGINDWPIPAPYQGSSSCQQNCENTAFMCVSRTAAGLPVSACQAAHYACLQKCIPIDQKDAASLARLNAGAADQAKRASRDRCPKPTQDEADRGFTTNDCQPGTGCPLDCKWARQSSNDGRYCYTDAERASMKAAGKYIPFRGEQGGTVYRGALTIRYGDEYKLMMDTQKAGGKYVGDYMKNAEAKAQAAAQSKSAAGTAAPAVSPADCQAACKTAWMACTKANGGTVAARDGPVCKPAVSQCLVKCQAAPVPPPPTPAQAAANSVRSRLAAFNASRFKSHPALEPAAL